MVRDPLQLRSRETLERVAAATERLLEERPFEEITIGEILRQARCSSGSFYARFGSKDALLPFLYERYDAELRPRIEARMERTPWRELTFRDACAALVRGTLEMYLERRNLMRALALYARTHPDAFSDSFYQQRREVQELPLAVLRPFLAQVPHPSPEAALRMGFFVVACAAREKLLFGDAPHAAVTPVTLDGLTRELTHVLHSYLATPPP
ncbi:TetR/AcrR family transcriptional regulator [Longimicrobium sp.]|jgi:AcrR family transcriptional regulator|uniref:TetR/AcrR family transcriptional regulator n=1 Tax=Longimicrobium sp. TaxID=2029185 RepID=UPI002ED93E16